MGMALDYEIDPNEESDSASNFDSSFEYWDPVSDTYKDKRTNKSVPDEIEARMGTALDYETDPNEESDSAASSDLNYEYWDPVSDTYKDKRTNETVADDIRLEKGVTIGNGISPDREFVSVSNLNSKIGEYRDPVKNSYRNESEANKGDEAWTLTARADSTKDKKQKRKTKLKYQAKPVKESKSEAMIRYNEKSNEKPNLLATGTNLGQETNTNIKRTIRLLRTFMDST